MRGPRPVARRRPAGHGRPGRHRLPGQHHGPRRPAPRPLGAGELLDTGGHVLEWVDTPHVPHGWDAGVLVDHSTRTLLCGDLFTRTGSYPATTTDDIVGPAVAAEDLFAAMSLHPTTAATIRALAERDVATLAPLHAPAFTGDCPAALRALAADAERRISALHPTG